jgi:hypothetical protein
MSLQNTAGVSKTDTPVTPHRPLQFKLKREIILVLLFKLVLLFQLKLLFSTTFASRCSGARYGGAHVASN